MRWILKRDQKRHSESGMPKQCQGRRAVSLRWETASRADVPEIRHERRSLSAGRADLQRSRCPRRLVGHCRSTNAAILSLENQGGLAAEGLVVTAGGAGCRTRSGLPLGSVSAVLFGLIQGGVRSMDGVFNRAVSRSEGRGTGADRKSNGVMVP